MEEKALVHLTLADGKFHIGIIPSLTPNPVTSNAFVRILPMVSGYRDADTKELQFTTFYEDVYAELVTEPNFKEEWLAGFLKVLPVASIVSANRFDPAMYVRFAKERESAEDQETQDTATEPLTLQARSADQGKA